MMHQSERCNKYQLYTFQANTFLKLRFLATKSIQQRT